MNFNTNSYIVLLITIVVHCNLCFAANSTYKFRQLRQIWQQKCKSNSDDPNAFQNLLDRATNCWEHHLNDFEPLSLSWNKFCHLLRNEIYVECVNYVLDSVSKCLASQEHESVEYIVKVYNFTASEYCSPEEQYVLADFLELMKIPSERECVKNYFLGTDCFVNSGTYKHLKTGNFSLLYPNFCFDLRATFPCIRDDLATECNGKYKYVVEILFNPFWRACSKDTRQNTYV